MADKLSKGKTRKEAYKLIYQGGATHQSAFDTLRAKSQLGGDDLADIISKVPGRKQYEAKKAMWIAAIICLSVVVLLRVMGIAVIILDLNVPPPILLLLVLFGIAVPILGIYAAATARIDALRTAGILLLLGIFRSFTKNTFPKDGYFFIGIALFAVAAGLCLYLAFAFKTEYKKSVETVEVGDKTKKRAKYTFENHGVVDNDELLDSI